MANKHNYKITDEQFVETLKETNGKLAHVPKAIYNTYGISYSRQGVYERAKRFARELKKIRIADVDYSKNRLIRCLNCDAVDPMIHFKISKYILNNLGKDRGYGKNGVDRILHPAAKVIEIETGSEHKINAETKLDNVSLSA